MKNFKKILSIFLICATLICSFSLTANAGSAINTTDSRTYEKEFQASVWHNSNEDVEIKDGKIVFPKNSSRDTKLVCKNIAEKSEIYNELFSAEFTIKFNALPSGKVFSFAMALDTIESSLGDPGNIEVEFTNKGGVYATVKSYDNDGKGVNLSSSTNVGALQSEIKVTALITVDAKLTVTINDVTVCNSVASKVDPIGRAGFLQTGSCEAEVSGLVFKNYNYDLPENTNIFEDFNEGHYNKNVISSATNYSSIFPTGICVEDYKGQKALVIENSLVGWLSTKHRYSNFELQYDVLYQQNFPIFNDDGSVYSAKHQYHTIAFGCEAASVDGWGGAEGSGGTLLVGANGGVLVNVGKGHLLASPDYNFTTKENSEKGYTIKLRLVDNVLTVYIKWLNEKEFYELGTVDEMKDEPTPLGFIQMQFNTCANMVIDNLRITNLDKKPNLVEVEYSKNTYPEVSHAEYVKPEVKYKKVTADAEKGGFNFFLVTAGVAALCVVAIGATVLVTVIIKKKRLKKVGETSDE